MRIESILNEEFCNRLVISTSAIIGHQILITDAEGLVLASSDSTRLGTLHEASLDVIHTGKIMYHGDREAEEMEGTKPGMTLPICMDDVPIGTIGITGSPEETSQYAALIQQLSKLFLDFQSQQLTTIQRDNEKKNLIQEITTFDRHTRDIAVIKDSAWKLGFNLGERRKVLIIRVAHNDERNLSQAEKIQRQNHIMEYLSSVFSNRQDIVAAYDTEEYVIMAKVRNELEEETIIELAGKCMKLQERAAPGRFYIWIGMGKEADSVETLKASYEDALFALRVQAAWDISSRKILDVEDLMLEQMAVNLSDELCDKLWTERFEKMMSAKNSDEIAELVICWCRSKFNFSQTAKDMHIHKSTLLYRFDRIKELYGLDLHDFSKVIALYLLIIRRKLI